MRALLAAVFLSVTAFHCALSASLGGAEKEEKAFQNDGLAELLKVDQMEFEAAQKGDAALVDEPTQFEAAQTEDVLVVNVTVEDSDEVPYLEAVKEGCEKRQGPADVNTGGHERSEAAVSRDGVAVSETESSSSSEEAA